MCPNTTTTTTTTGSLVSLCSKHVHALFIPRLVPLSLSTNLLKAMIACVSSHSVRTASMGILFWHKFLSTISNKIGTKEDVAFRTQIAQQCAANLLRAFASKLCVHTSVSVDSWMEKDFLDLDEYLQFSTSFRGELLMSMGIIASIQPLVSVQHLQWLASQHISSPQDASLYAVMSRSFESCIPRLNFAEANKPVLSAGTSMVRAFVDLTKRTLMSATFDPRRPNCYVKCLGSFETHFAHDTFRSLLIPLVAFLLDCLSKGCPSESVLKDWRTMRRTIGNLLVSVSRKHEALFRPSFNDLCKRVAQLTRLGHFDAEERGMLYQTLTHLEQRAEFLSQILQAPLTDWRCEIFVRSTKSVQAFANFVRDVPSIQKNTLEHFAFHNT